MAAQIQANAIRPTTKKTDFARQLKKILDANPGMSHAKLQGLIHKNPGWIGEQLGLLRLTQVIQKAVDRGEIPLMSAYMLSRIMPSQQYRFVDLAKNQRSVPCTQTPPDAVLIIKPHIDFKTLLGLSSEALGYKPDGEVRRRALGRVRCGTIHQRPGRDT